MIVCVPVWFLGGLLVGMISPGRTFIEPMVASFVIAIPTTFLLVQSQTVRTMPTFLYVVMSAIGDHVHADRRVHRRAHPARTAAEARRISGVGATDDSALRRRRDRRRAWRLDLRVAARAAAASTVVVLEKAMFPRFHLGESLLPQSLPVLEAIGVLDAVEARFIQKYGARFHDDIARPQGSLLVRRRAGTPESRSRVPGPARRVRRAPPRSRGARCGADVRERWSVDRRRVDEAGARSAACSRSRRTATDARIDARFVVDASGRDALFAHAARATTKIDGLDQTALFAHFEGVARHERQARGRHRHRPLRESASARPNWFWIIPFKDGRTSVGAVVSKRVDARSPRADRRGRDRRHLQRRSSAQRSPSRAPRRSSSRARRCLWPTCRSDGRLQLSRARDDAATGWIAVGDAGGFIDPLFSTGAHSR